MDATEILHDLQESGITIKTDGRFLELEPPEKITNELIERLRKHKPAIIQELKREQRRERVLQMLEDNPAIKRAFVTDCEADPDHVILALAIRHVGSCEMTIPRPKYDAFAVLEVIKKSSIQ